MEIVISVHNPEKSYGVEKAVDGISFDVKKGTIFGLLGHNGAGKSTTLECIPAQSLLIREAYSFLAKVRIKTGKRCSKGSASNFRMQPIPTKSGQEKSAKSMRLFTKTLRAGKACLRSSALPASSNLP